MHIIQMFRAWLPDVQYSLMKIKLFWVYTFRHYKKHLADEELSIFKPIMILFYNHPLPSSFYSRMRLLNFN